MNDNIYQIFDKYKKNCFDYNLWLIFLYYILKIRGFDVKDQHFTSNYTIPMKLTKDQIFALESLESFLFK
jgi:hypothetical protein